MPSPFPFRSQFFINACSSLASCFGSCIAASTASSPEGPWSAPVTIWGIDQIPYSLPGDSYMYPPAVQPETSEADGSTTQLIYTHASNDADTGEGHQILDVIYVTFTRQEACRSRQEHENVLTRMFGRPLL